MRPGPLRDSLPDHHAMLPGGMDLPAAPTLLVVDDDPAMLQTLVWYFEQRGFHVAAAATLAEAKSSFRRSKSWSLVLADDHLPDGTGRELAAWIHEQTRPPTPFLLMSGNPSSALLCGGLDYLAKPFSLHELEACIRPLFHRR